ncbi:MAG: rod shape-determining protein MreD [Polyangiaceae bacterium]
MRNVAFIAVGFLLLLVQANLYRVLGPLGLHGATPSLVLPLLIFLGVHEPSMLRGAGLCFVLGYLLDVMASAPPGLFTFVSVVLWLVSRVAGVRLTTQTLLTRMSLAFGFAVVEAFIVLTLLAIFGSDTRKPLEMLSLVLPRAASTAVFAPFVFSLAQRLHQAAVPGQAAAEATRQ